VEEFGKTISPATYEAPQSCRQHLLIYNTSGLRERAEQQWASLPESFRMKGSLKNHDEGAWERDFLVSTRLGYLHVLFLLRLLCVRSPADPDPEFVRISQEILSLVVEVIVLRDQLVCSTGTSFEWRVSEVSLSHWLPILSLIQATAGTLRPSSNRDHNDSHAQRAESVRCPTGCPDYP
jgi:hypothetical protein